MPAEAECWLQTFAAAAATDFFSVVATRAAMLVVAGFLARRLESRLNLCDFIGCVT